MPAAGKKVDVSAAAPGATIKSPSDQAESRKKMTDRNAIGPMKIAVKTTSNVAARPAKIHGARISSAVAAPM